MKTLGIIASIFLLVCGIGAAYFATSGPGHEYDMKLVLPIDTRHMPSLIELPHVEGNSEVPASEIPPRAEAAPLPEPADRHLFQFGDKRPAAELRASE